MKLFHDWFGSWSDDQKNYLVLRLRDIDAAFFADYERRVADPNAAKAEKDYFEPGIPEELIRTPTVVSDKNDGDGDNDLKKGADDSSSSTLSPISEQA